MKPITKFSTSIIDAARVSSTIAHAITIAEDEKPGAVHIELAEDIARDDASEYQPIVFDKMRRPVPDEKAIQSIVSYLRKAHRPMILVGA
jgi:acetolactate synthase-1/2/3 large subunit